MADDAQEPQIDRETLYAIIRKLAVAALALKEARDLLVVAQGNSLAAGSVTVLLQSVDAIGREMFEALAEVEAQPAPERQTAPRGGDAGLRTTFPVVQPGERDGPGDGDCGAG